MLYLLKYKVKRNLSQSVGALKSVGFSRSSSLDDKMVTCQVEWKILRTILEGFFFWCFETVSPRGAAKLPKFPNSKVKPCNPKSVRFSTLFKNLSLYFDVTQ